MSKEVIDERVESFLLKMEEIFGCDKETFKKLFKPRKSDYYFLAYDQNYRVYAYSNDGENWFKSGIGKFEYHFHVTIPARGSIWHLKKNKTVYLVTDFVNIDRRKSNESIPSVVYMNEMGQSMTMPIVLWHTNMQYVGRKVK